MIYIICSIHFIISVKELRLPQNKFIYYICFTNHWCIYLSYMQLVSKLIFVLQILESVIYTNNLWTHRRGLHSILRITACYLSAERRRVCQANSQMHEPHHWLKKVDKSMMQETVYNGRHWGIIILRYVLKEE